MAFRDIDPAYSCLEALNRYCVNGSLIRFARDTFHSVLCRLNRERGISFLRDMLMRPISVKKHAIRAINRLLEMGSKVKLFKELCETQTHPTARYVLVKALLESVTSESQWPVIKFLLGSLRDIDHDVACLVTNASIPSVHVTEFYKIVTDDINPLPRGRNFDTFHAWTRTEIKRNARFLDPQILSELLELLMLNPKPDSSKFAVEPSSVANIAVDFVLSTAIGDGIEEGSVIDTPFRASVIQSQGLACLDRLFSLRLNSLSLTESVFNAAEHYISLETFITNICIQWVDACNGSDGSNKRISCEEIINLCERHLCRLPRAPVAPLLWSIRFTRGVAECAVIAREPDDQEEKRNNKDSSETNVCLSPGVSIGISIAGNVSRIVDDDPHIASLTLPRILLGSPFLYLVRDEKRYEIMEGILSTFMPAAARGIREICEASKSLQYLPSGNHQNSISEGSQKFLLERLLGPDYCGAGESNAPFDIKTTLLWYATIACLKCDFAPSYEKENISTLVFHYVNGSVLDLDEASQIRWPLAPYGSVMTPINFF